MFNLFLIEEEIGSSISAAAGTIDIGGGALPCQRFSRCVALEINCVYH